MMTKLEIMRKNKADYAKMEKMIASGKMNALEKAVAENITLKWIKGNKWMGGLGCGMAEQRCFERVMRLGYDFEEIDEEFTRQMKMFGL